MERKVNMAVMHRRLKLLLSILFNIFPLFAQDCSGSTPATYNLHWNSSNQLFRSSKEGPSIELPLNSRLSFHCPYYASGEGSGATPEHYIIYRVPLQYYNSCSLPVNISEFSLVTTCESPNTNKIFSVYLEEFSPLPGSHGGLQFNPGGTYYFISTSVGTPLGISNRESSLSSCLTQGMRFQLRIKSNSNSGSALPPRPYSTRRRTSSVTPPSPSAHGRNHNSHRAGLVNSLTPEPVSPTTEYIKPQYPQAIINAEVTLDSSSCTLSSGVTFVLSLLYVLYLLI